MNLLLRRLINYYIFSVAFSVSAWGAVYHLNNSVMLQIIQNQMVLDQSTVKSAVVP